MACRSYDAVLRSLIILMAAAAGMGLSILRIGTAKAGEYSTMEEACFNEVQGKVAWNQAGSTAWEPENIRLLCKRVGDYSARLTCFAKSVQTHNQWRKAIDDCANVGVYFPETYKSPIDAAAGAKLKFIQIAGLVVNARTEAGNDDVYIYVDHPYKGRTRIPAVQRIYMGKESSTPYSAPQSKYGDAYFSITMNETDPTLKTWNVCKTFSTNSILSIQVKEKDIVYTTKDNGGVNPDDLIGTVAIDANSTAEGAHSESLTGDGGNYTFVYHVAKSEAALPKCAASETVRDLDYIPPQQLRQTPCEAKCDSATGGAAGGCSLQVSRECSQTAVVLLGCIAACSLAGGNK